MSENSGENMTSSNPVPPGEMDWLNTSDQQESEIYGGQPVDDEDQLQPEVTLDDRNLEDVLDRGYAPAERPPPGYEDYPTLAEQREGGHLDDYLRAEVPEPDPYHDNPIGEQADPLRGDDVPDENALPEDVHDHDPGSLPEARAGRLVAPDEGVGEDETKEMLATDVGIDGAAATAEEAAMHIEDVTAGDRRLEDEREGRPRG
ncbi:MAG: DUF5709 domain-containing protein [Marmoricola sp.]